MLTSLFFFISFVISCHDFSEGITHHSEHSFHIYALILWPSVPVALVGGSWVDIWLLVTLGWSNFLSAVVIINVPFQSIHGKLICLADLTHVNGGSNHWLHF